MEPTPHRAPSVPVHQPKRNMSGKKQGAIKKHNVPKATALLNKFHLSKSVPDHDVHLKRNSDNQHGYDWPDSFIDFSASRLNPLTMSIEQVAKVPGNQYSSSLKG